MTIYSLALGLHIMVGTLALLVAPAALVCVKGSQWHRRWGKTYFWCMAGVAASAILLCALGAGFFLFMIALFSFYLAATGYRTVYIKRPHSDHGTLDWVMTAAMAITALALIGFGVGQLVSGNIMGLVPLMFGGIGAALGGLDLIRFLSPTDPKAWWFEHMIRMLSAYIATVSAFSVVNFTFLPELLRWLWPSLVGGTAITLWVRHYKIKFSRRAAPSGS